jgi:hypothetical protein
VVEDLPRRYKVLFEKENSVRGEVVFEGDSELSGIITPFQGKEV